MLNSSASCGWAVGRFEAAVESKYALGFSGRFEAAA